jgi:hypothetical protein
MTALADNEPVLILKEKNFTKIHSIHKVPNSARVREGMVGMGMEWKEKEDGIGKKESSFRSIRVKKGSPLMNTESMTLLASSTHILPLTLHGQLKLSVFPLETIRHLLTLPFNYKALDPFAYLFKCALSHFKKSDGLDLDFRVFNKYVENQRIRYEPFIDAEMFEIIKMEMEEKERTPQRDRVKTINKGNATSGQQSDILKGVDNFVFRRQEERYNAACKEQEESKKERVRALGMDPDELSFSDISRLLKGNITPEKLRLELVSDNSARKLSKVRPDTPEAFQGTRADVVNYLEFKVLVGDALNPFEKLLLDGFKDTSPDSPANPLTKTGVTFFEAMDRLAAIPPEENERMMLRKLEVQCTLAREESELQQRLF